MTNKQDLTQMEFKIQREDAVTVLALAQSQNRVQEEAKKAMAEVNASIDSLASMCVAKYGLDNSLEWQFAIAGEDILLRVVKQDGVQGSTQEPTE